ncbi:MAG: UPF0149 family protein [Gammaproteobacteria bacterium]|nr:UPF0149 family protein [Gammaproteobacteria bacterium]NNK33010.1 UPF0149 family protein [Xanthomonadales bacterium]
MSAPSLPDFQHTLQLSQGNLDAAELAECHGLLCGLACRASDGSDDFLGHLAAMQLVVEPGAALIAALVDAWEVTQQQLIDEEMGFSLWLPDDEEPLEERTIALAQWCSGFIAGLASGGQLEALSEEASEAIADLQEIARAELSAAPGAPAENEEDEAAYAEIVEYVRVVALTMHEEFRGPDPEDAIH